MHVVVLSANQLVLGATWLAAGEEGGPPGRVRLCAAEDTCVTTTTRDIVGILSGQRSQRSTSTASSLGAWVPEALVASLNLNPLPPPAPAHPEHLFSPPRVLSEWSV